MLIPPKIAENLLHIFFIGFITKHPQGIYRDSAPEVNEYNGIRCITNSVKVGQQQK